MAQIDKWIVALVNEGGSDLHLSAGRVPMIRKSGEVVPLVQTPVSAQDTEAMLREIAPEDRWQEFLDRSDTDFSYEMPDFARLRVNVYRDQGGVGGVMRAIPTKVISTEDLDLPESALNLCDLQKGLVVVTGPTGSGKSTTLASMIDLINRTRHEHIVTIEDPIEFIHREINCHITQREVHSHTTSFAMALRAALRQDPDIVLVGEMRDLETVEAAIDTAETGHLVFGTLHTNSAASSIDRIIDSFDASRQNQVRAMLANSLKGVIAQALCPRRDGGMVAALEVLVVDRGIASLIRDGKTHQIPAAMQMGRGLGMQQLNDGLLTLVREGIVDPFVAYRKAVDKEDLAGKLNKIGIPLTRPA